jgi:hypothetical protein
MNLAIGMLVTLIKKASKSSHAPHLVRGIAFDFVLLDFK